MASEFDLIKKYFARPAPSALLGVGDDAALLAPTPGMVLAVSTDMLVAGTHFFPETDPCKLGWKTLAVNLSDLAAMGAQPRWATLSLSLPHVDEHWLSGFSDGLFRCAAQHDVALVGGDTTRGPLTLNVTLLGEVPGGQALRRDCARADDDIWISGTLGAAALALAALEQRLRLDETGLNACLRALETPQPRVALGLALRGIAHAAIDVSDGLLADLGHILTGSGLGAEISFATLPAHPALTARLAESGVQPCLLSGGEDYELCFTASPQRRAEIADISGHLALPLTRIGRITPDTGLRLRDDAGKLMETEASGYDHFA